MQAAIVAGSKSALRRGLLQHAISSRCCLHCRRFRSRSIDQAGQFVAKLAGEVELAMAITLPDLSRQAEAIRLGHMATPKFPEG